MNIFHLDSDPGRSAEYYVDRHIVKIPLEVAQLLCTAIIVNGGVAPYKLSHAHHPITKVIGASRSNFADAITIGMALCQEYTYRYGRIHKCEAIIANAMSEAHRIADAAKLNWPQCVPSDCKSDDLVAAYRSYYTKYKRHLMSWKNRPRPDWYV